jgi:hypothetical protein
VRLNGQTRISGDYYNWWYPGGDVSFYFNGTLKNTSGWQRVVTLGAEFDLGYTPTLQTYGPGQYYQSTAHDAFTPYCNYNGQNTFSAMCQLYGCVYPPPWNSSAYINIVRPTRPDYGSAGHPVFFLGAGISSDGSYSNNTSLVAGNPNGAPETPQWIFAAGSSFGNLSCTSCNQPLFTATKRSSYCQDFSVVLETSYNGFLSDPFYMFIDGPNNTIAANCPASMGCPPGTWNYTFAAAPAGWQSIIYYQTMSLCSSSGAMTSYDLNESFGSWTADYAGENWTPATPISGSAGTNGLWYDWLWYTITSSTPPPQSPTWNCFPHCGTTKVQHAAQTFRAGTPTTGQGYAIQQNTHQRFLDHGEHDNIVTPVSQ